MKWILVTTTPTRKEREWNIGDVFARLGTEILIREVDPKAEFDLADMNDPPTVLTERPFDRCVLAGRPLFWKNCELYPEWRGILHGWMGRDPKKVLIFGVGTCYPPGDFGAHIHDRILEARAATFARPILRCNCADPEAIAGICPAAFVFLDREEKPTMKLCNFMPSGGHYSTFSPDESARWAEMEKAVAFFFRQQGFVCVAHTDRERQHAANIGFPQKAILYSLDIEDYIRIYASASHYFGNRMHGAVACCARNARVVAVGYDSRLQMVSQAGGLALLPSQVRIETLYNLICDGDDDYFTARLAAIRAHRQQMLEVLRAFANQP